MRASRRAKTRLECETLEDRVTPATLTWTGAVDGLWSHVGNWTTTDVTHPVPQNGDAVVLPAGALNRTQSDDLGQLTLSSITFNDIGYNLSGSLIDLGNISVAPAGLMTGGDSIANDLVFVVTAPSDQATIDLGSARELLSLGGSVEVAGAGTLTVTSGGAGAALGVANLAVLATATLSIQNTNATIFGQAAIYGVFAISGNSRVDIAPAAIVADAGTVSVNAGASLYIAGLVDVEAQNGTGGVLTNNGGLVLVESSGSLYVAVRIDNISGELYIAGLTVLEQGSLLTQQTSAAFTVVAPGGELYVAWDMIGNNGAQLYVFGQVVVANNGNDGIGFYQYDGTIAIEAGGALYAYGLVAIEANSALYDYGTLALEPNGYLYSADLVVIEQGGVFYDYGTFANFGTYYNFGHQIGG